MNFGSFFDPWDEEISKNDGEKWSRKNVFEIPPCAKPFSD
jgi:hypothetical protein